MKKIFAFLTLAALAAASCGTRSTYKADGEYIYKPRHAEGFVITEAGNSSVLTIKNPWQGAENVEMNVFLSVDGQTPPEGFDGAVVNVPVQRVVCMSSSYIALLDELGMSGVVRGVSGAGYVSNEKILERYAAGDVRDVGYDSNLNYELIASLRPDIVMIYGIAGENSAVSAKLTELGINVIYIGDYLEQSPLGKAEWLVAFGELLGMRGQAQGKFDRIEERYTEILSRVSQASVEEGFERPLVMLNAPYKDTWFVPGDRSYMVRLINDAGGAYACAGDDSERSRPISTEASFVLANASDVWLNPGQVTSKAGLLAENPRFGNIPPVVNGRVYNCNRRSTPGGGSDFWESGAARPDIVLADIAAILHPEIMPGHELYYFREIR